MIFMFGRSGSDFTFALYSVYGRGVLLSIVLRCVSQNMLTAPCTPA